jgi:DNA-binding MarR family transcriptional regulator
MRDEDLLVNDTCPACSAARRAARAVTQLYDLCLAPTKIRATQFVILRAICDRGEVSQSSLSREQAASTETLSRRLASMRKAGWIKLRVAGKHQEHLYSLTPEGARVLSDAQPFWRGADERLCEALSSISHSSMAETIKVLDALATAAQKGTELRATNGARKVARAA